MKFSDSCAKCMYDRQMAKTDNEAYLSEVKAVDTADVIFSKGQANYESFAGEGLGTILMEYAIDFAKSAGYQCMELGVLSDNTTAQGLYKKMGFVEWGRLPDAFHLDSGEGVDEITMYKKLKYREYGLLRKE